MAAVGDCLELQDFIRLHDISVERRDRQFMVVPERVLQEFRSSNGWTFDKLRAMVPFDSAESVQFLAYSRDTSNSRYPRLPSLPNSLKIWIFEPAPKAIGEKAPTAQDYHDNLETLSSCITSDIESVFQTDFCPVSRDDILQLTQSFAEGFAKLFPDYFMKFTPYGGELYGCTYNKKNCININIELDEPDLDRLVNRTSNPYYTDMGEPHCCMTTRPFDNEPQLKDEVFNMTQVTVTPEVRVEYSFNKSIVTKSSELIEEYVRMDERVGPLLFIVKHICRHKGIDVELGSHALMVMTLAYLQSLEPPVVPNLQNISNLDMEDNCYDETCLSKEKYWDTAVFQGTYIGAASRFHTCVVPKAKGKLCRHTPAYDPTQQQLTWTSANTMSIGELFMDFMYYYGFSFDYDTYAVSLKHDSKTRKKQCFRSQGVVVEDPVLSGINLSWKVTNVSRLLEYFRGVFTLLWDGIHYKEILMTPKINRFHIDYNGQNNMKYKILMRKRKSIKQLKVILLLGIPKVQDAKGECDCEWIGNCLKVYGRVRKMQNLDSQTKIVGIDIMENVTLPVNMKILDKTVHLIELFEVNQ